MFNCCKVKQKSSNADISTIFSDRMFDRHYSTDDYKKSTLRGGCFS